MGAPRLLLRGVMAPARGGLRALYLGLMLLGLGQTVAAEHQRVCVDGDGTHIEQVCYVDTHGPVAYGHGVLGNTPEWDALHIFWGRTTPAGFKRDPMSDVLDMDHVFEDTAPRLVDLDGDGVPEIIVVQSSLTKGARLVVYSIADGLRLTATPYIGTRFRWLAVIGAADLDGDGHVEIAYVDRPHLARTLRVWRYKDGVLEAVASQKGLTNHRIGEDFITGGMRDCGAGPEMITADAGWGQVVATRLTSGRLESRALGRFSQAAVAAALAC